MWRSRYRSRKRVTCPACGRTVRRADAREYDKYGDRWERRGKEFEYFCKSCHDAMCHLRRDDLENLLEEIGAGHDDTAAFLRRYWRVVRERYGTLEER